MKKVFFVLVVTVFSNSLFAQTDERISTLEFVEVLDGNYNEALYYFENNWKELRDKALEKGIIASYEFVRTEPTDDYPIDIVLITTYKNEEQFNAREANFEKIMKGRKLKLLNEIQPANFRRTVFVKERSTHSFK